MALHRVPGVVHKVLQFYTGGEQRIREAHSKKYYSGTTEVPQKYHRSTIEVPQKYHGTFGYICCFSASENTLSTETE